MSGVTKKIIIAPLNWGLGHATRCIPIVQTYIDHGHEVLIASDGSALNLLRKEFPGIKSVELPSYDIQYGSDGMAWNMAKQLPKIRQAIRAEHDALRILLIDFRADLIISDNRYGCYHTICPSVIICHQVNIPVHKFIAPIVNTIHHQFLLKFKQVWIPDVAGDQRLSGVMTSKIGRLNVKHIGLLSRFNILPEVIIKDQIICVLSGPEPQRSYFETKLIQQLSALDKPSFLIQGKLKGPEGQTLDQVNKLTIINYLTGKSLNKRLQESRYIISRSGYSTIMDLVKINRSALLIPTPGQPEQEYLGRYLAERKWMVSQQQSELNINNFLNGETSSHLPKIKTELLENLIKEWI